MSGKQVRCVFFSLVIVIILVGVSALQYFNISLISFDSQAPATSLAQAATPPLPEQMITIHHSSGSGISTYSGSLSVPMCDIIGTGIQTIGSNPAHITLLLTTIGQEGCTSTDMAQQDFSVSASTRSAAQFDGVLINGQTASSTLVED